MILILHLIYRVRVLFVCLFATVVGRRGNHQGLKLVVKNDNNDEGGCSLSCFNMRNCVFCTLFLRPLSVSVSIPCVITYPEEVTIVQSREVGSLASSQPITNSFHSLLDLVRLYLITAFSILYISVQVDVEECTGRIDDYLPVMSQIEIVWMTYNVEASFHFLVEPSLEVLQRIVASLCNLCRKSWNMIPCSLNLTR